MTQLTKLELRIRSISEERARGDAFEAAVLPWLTSDPDLGFRAAWRWADWPERVHRKLKASDDGVDLVAEDLDGRLVAVQVKFRSDPDRPISREEAQKALSYPDVFARYLLVSNAWDRTRSAARGLAGEGRLTWALRPELDGSAFDWDGSLRTPALSGRSAPRPHQVRAIEDAVTALAEPGRAQLHMACGTGKTLTALWITERLSVEHALVLAPTLLLLKQLRAEWLREASEPFAALAVCSSDDVGDGIDGWELDPSDIPGEVTTDPAVIAEFLSRPGRRIIFSTYQSSPRIAEAQADPAIPTFDLAVADEAHKVAGVGSKRGGRTSALRTILEAIRADRRLFLTATPRVYGAGHRSRLEEEFGVEVASMDDTTLFGPVAHTFGFRAAVDAAILVDYRLVVTIADDEGAAEAVRERQFVDVSGRPVPADQVATAIAVRRAVEELGLRRAISFHSTVAKAKAFAGLLGDLPMDGAPPEARWISGAQPVHDRELVLSELRNPEATVVVSNARCLTEGIDIPALDAVAFADPRSSAIDLVQAIGRAMRSAPGKTTGWVIVPVHLGPNALGNPEAAVESSAFEPVIAVLRALRSHDPLLAADASRIRLSLGPMRNLRSTGADLAEIRIDLVGPANLPMERLLEAIRLRAIDVSADPWSRGFAALLNFVAHQSHARVPVNHVEGGVNLGSWARSRRAEYRQGRLPRARVVELESLPGWTWDPFADDWIVAMEALRAFVSRNGHARVPDDYVAGRVNLGWWVKSRRVEYRQGRLASARVAQLEALLGWKWDPGADNWAAAMKGLGAFVAREGHARVPMDHVEEGVKLGSWIRGRRVDFRSGSLRVDRVAELEALPGWSWDPGADDWLAAVDALRAVVAREGHARVRVGHTEGGVRLGPWVAKQRSEHNSGRLSPERTAELDALPGWTWDPVADDWEAAVNALRELVASNGSARLPRGRRDDTAIRLGLWATARRAEFKAGRLVPERIRELEALPGWSWDPKADDWTSAMEAIRQFIVREGHARVPRGRLKDGSDLGSWVLKLRSQRNKGGMAPERILELEALPGWTWDPVADDWTASLVALRAFVAREGHARPPRDRLEAGVNLGSWTTSRRADFRDGRLSRARITELETVPGWTWDPVASFTGAASTAMRRFIAREGHARVPYGHIENGIKLGIWTQTRRHEYRSGRLTERQIAELEALPGWSWDPGADDWAAAIAALRTFVAREGHARVPAKHVEGGLRLGSRVNVWRTMRKAGRLDVARVRELEGVPGWTWDPIADDSVATVAALRLFIAREGHSRVPPRHVENGIRLGAWVERVRTKRRAGRLPEARVADLEAIPGWAWAAGGPSAKARRPRQS